VTSKLGMHNPMRTVECRLEDGGWVGDVVSVNSGGSCTVVLLVVMVAAVHVA
jgi:hypothetical protein